MKKNFGNRASLNVLMKSLELLFFGFMVSKKAQSIFMMLISFLLLADVIGHFQNYLIKAGAALLGLAAVGSYYRKHWVKYCFFAWGIFIYVKGLILLLASVKSGGAHIVLLNVYVHLFILQCFYALPFFGAGFLAQLFFNESAKSPPNSKSGDFGLACSAAICAFMSPSLVGLITNSSILPTPQNLIIRAATAGVSEKWLLAVITLPELTLNMVCAAVIVFMLAMLFRVWSRWHTVIATLFIILLYLVVGFLNFLFSYLAKKWSIEWFLDGYETVLLPISGIAFGILAGGLLAAYIKKRQW